MSQTTTEVLNLSRLATVAAGLDRSGNPWLACRGCGLDTDVSTLDFANFAAVWHSRRCDRWSRGQRYDHQSDFDLFEAMVAYVLSSGRRLRLNAVADLVRLTDPGITRRVLIVAASEYEQAPSPGVEAVLECAVEAMGGADAVTQQPSTIATLLGCSTMPKELPAAAHGRHATVLAPATTEA